MKFGVREICDVVFKAKSAGKIGKYSYGIGQPVLYIDSAKTSTMEGAATTVYATGGKGNNRLVAWEGEKTLTFTVEDALLSPISFSILAGAGLFEPDSNNKAHVHTTARVGADQSLNGPLGVGSQVIKGHHVIGVGLQSHLSLIHHVGISTVGDGLLQSVVATIGVSNRGSSHFNGSISSGAGAPSAQAALEVSAIHNVAVSRRGGQSAQGQNGAQHGQASKHSQNFAHFHNLISSLKNFGKLCNSGEWAASVEPPVPMRVFSHHKRRQTEARR